MISRILGHLGLPTDRPVARPARAPPLFAVAGDARVDVDESARRATPEWCSMAERHGVGES